MGLIENLKRRCLEKEIEVEAHRTNDVNGESDFHRRRYELLQKEYHQTYKNYYSVPFKPSPKQNNNT